MTKVRLSMKTPELWQLYNLWSSYGNLVVSYFPLKMSTKQRYINGETNDGCYQARSDPGCKVAITARAL